MCFLFCFWFLLLCHCVTRSCQVNHFLIRLQIIRFYAYYSKRNDVSSQSTLSVLIVNRNNEQMLLMYFRFACSRDIFRCNQLLYGTGPFWKYSRSLSKELDLLLILNNQESCGVWVYWIGGRLWDVVAHGGSTVAVKPPTNLCLLTT